MTVPKRVSDTDLNRGRGSSQTETIAVRSFPNPKSPIQNPKWYEKRLSFNGAGFAEVFGMEQSRH
jgi:hypothetical protein